MARPIRSPVLGFNHNVKYRGKIFHVQTEDSGPTSPRISTQLYFGGTILASKRHEYDPAAAEDVVRALMQSQHKSIMKELRAARHDARIGAFFQSRGETLEAPVAPAHAEGSLDLDAPLPEPGQRALRDDIIINTTFSDTFDDEPTTLDPPPYSAVSSTADVIIDEPEPAPPPPAPRRPAQVTGSYATVSSREGPWPRPVQTTPVLGGQVLIQRTVSVGGESGPTGKEVPRPRRPAQSIPYVVKEGSHPVAEPALASRTQLDLPIPPPAAILPVSDPQAPAAPPTPTAAEPALDRSLDEVILAYLARGENDQH
jgi:hypothetical protein